MKGGEIVFPVSEKIKFALRSLFRPACVVRYIAPDGRKMVVFFEKSSTGVKRVCKFEIKREFHPNSFEPHLEEIEFDATNKEWYEKSTAAD